MATCGEDLPGCLHILLCIRHAQAQEQGRHRAVQPYSGPQSVGQLKSGGMPWGQQL